MSPYHDAVDPPFQSRYHWVGGRLTKRIPPPTPPMSLFNNDVKFANPLEVHLHTDAPAELGQIIQYLKTIMADLSNLEAAVARNSDVVDSAVVLLKGLKDALDAAGTDPVKLKELSDKLGSETDALAEAVVANTPAAPPTP